MLFVRKVFKGVIFEIVKRYALHPSPVLEVNCNSSQTSSRKIFNLIILQNNAPFKSIVFHRKLISSQQISSAIKCNYTFSPSLMTEHFLVPIFFLLNNETVNLITFFIHHVTPQILFLYLSLQPRDEAFLRIMERNINFSCDMALKRNRATGKIGKALKSLMM